MQGVFFMNTDIEERSVIVAEFIAEEKATVRSAAMHFGISKSTVHTVRVT